MAGWNGGSGSSWSYRHEIRSAISSSRSGTIASTLSTAYASSGSRFSMEVLAKHFDSLGIHGDINGNNMDDWDREEAKEEETEEERIRRLVQEFFSAPSANCSTKVGDVSVVERWLTELGVGWLLSLHDGASVGEELDRDAQSWIRALHQIARTFCFSRPLDRPGIRCVPDPYHLALFIQETMLKMLAFVDLVVALGPYNTEESLSMDSAMQPLYSKLFSLLGVHHAVSEASNEILALFDSPTTVEVQRIDNKMALLLSTNKSKLGEAIWSTMEKATTRFLKDGDDSSTSLNPQGSSDIHKITWSEMMYLTYLCANYSSEDAAISGKSVPHIENVRPLDSIIMKTVSYLQEKLANISESFTDQGLRFLFLLNNTYFIKEFKCFYYLDGFLQPANLNDQIEYYMERYLRVSWAPLLSCLFNATPLCLGRNYCPLSKFESEFQKTYTTQKQWKVPNPELRRRLREVITDKIIPDYTAYIEDNKVTNPKISSKELEEMLQELFEG